MWIDHSDKNYISFDLTSTPTNILTDIVSLPNDSCCTKCFDLETKLQEALKELSTAHLIILNL